ncbi:MAG TPA: HAD family hydrolase [Acidimicrobiales bacterium]|nr:HAD family hydrolase [Acidimicrobiales bacterium]
MKADLRPGVLFDVDGTLFDTNYLHTLTWSRAFGDAGEWAPMNAIHRLVGMGSDQLVRELLGHESPESVTARPRRYKELISEARPFPGADDLLHQVSGSGLAVVIATSAVADELDRLLDMLDSETTIDAKTTADDIEKAKPDPEVFLRAMEVGSVDPRRALAVGDSVWDIQAARDAGIGCVAVESGGYSEHELSEAGALQVYRNVKEIHDQFRTSPLALLLP